MPYPRHLVMLKMGCQLDRHDGPPPRLPCRSNTIPLLVHHPIADDHLHLLVVATHTVAGDDKPHLKSMSGSVEYHMLPMTYHRRGRQNKGAR